MPRPRCSWSDNPRAFDFDSHPRGQCRLLQPRVLSSVRAAQLLPSCVLPLPLTHRALRPSSRLLLLDAACRAAASLRALGAHHILVLVTALCPARRHRARPLLDAVGALAAALDAGPPSPSCPRRASLSAALATRLPLAPPSTPHLCVASARMREKWRAGCVARTAETTSTALAAAAPAALVVAWPKID